MGREVRLGLKATLGLVAALLSAASSAQTAASADPDWRAMRLAGEKAVRDRLLLPKAAQFDWQFGFTQGSWKPYNSRPIVGWMTCGAAYTKDKFGYRHGGVFVVVIGKGRPYADVDSNPGGSVSRGCRGIKLPPPQPGMLDASTPAP